MKLTTPLLALLAMTSVYSYTLEDRNFKRNLEDTVERIDENLDKTVDKIEQGIENQKKKTNDLTNIISDNVEQFQQKQQEKKDEFLNKINYFFAPNSIDSECQKIIDEYNACFPGKLTVENYDKSCETFNTENCQKLINTSFDSYDVCKDYVSALQESLGFAIANMNVSCAKDENGEYCPISQFAKSSSTSELTDETINATCKSKSCRDKALSAFTLFNNVLLKKSKLNKRKYISEEQINQVITTLNDDKCAAQASGATTIKIGKTLLFTLGLFFYYL
ncbi:hypothetical protein H8356DRAFT_1728791 [Neocallimastix lanati (nom. inval.)]|nr:hypothetical protein H8356DRAFT_1728791 [Neocallimastix sp. JGI-2020a]